MDPEDDKDDSSDMDYTPHDFNEEVVRTGPHGGAKVDPEAVSATPVPGTAVVVVMDMVMVAAVLVCSDRIGPVGKETTNLTATNY